MACGGDRAEQVCVAGASGYVGGRLVERLVSSGHGVGAVVRDPVALGPGSGVRAHVTDVGDTDRLAGELAGYGAAFYLVHSMAGGGGFSARDRELARSFAEAAARAGVGRIVYLGGLGRGRLSEHLASRQEVGRVLGSTGVPVVELRAAVVLGAGSVSFEMLRSLTERLPAMVCPRWVTTRVQPIAEADLLAYLEASLDAEPGVYEIGSPDVTTYRDMMRAYARVRGLRRRTIVTVPVLTPSLSAHWVDLVTPVDATVSHALIESLSNEVTVHDAARTTAAFPVRPLPVADAIAAALDDQAARLPRGIFRRRRGFSDGVYTARHRAGLLEGVARDEAAAVARDLERCGGDLAWYGVPRAWWLRLALGRLVGEDLRLHRPRRVEAGARVDWWGVEAAGEGSLVLGTRSWFFGEAWLGWRVTGDPPSWVEQVGALRTRGLPGLAYWWLLWPVHQVVFSMMVRHRARSAHRWAAAVARAAAP